MLLNRLRMLNHGVQFNGSEIGMKFCISRKLSGRADAAGLRIHFEWQGLREDNINRIKKTSSNN